MPLELAVRAGVELRVDGNLVEEVVELGRAVLKVAGDASQEVLDNELAPAGLAVEDVVAPRGLGPLRRLLTPS